MEHNNLPPIVLSFSGHDPCGGAGIQADIESLSSIGCYCTPVVTAITVQDTNDVKDYAPTDTSLLIEQARAVLEDMPVAAFKIGMLGSIENAEAVHTILMDYPNIPVVLDPVFDAGGGSSISADGMKEVVQTLILPQTTVTTPNTVEAHRMAPQGDTLDACANEIMDTGCQYVLITGTHAQTRQVTNNLYYNFQLQKSFTWERLANIYHGSGCTLAASLAGYLAHKLDIVKAVELAQTFTWNSLKNGRRLGMGQLIPNRMFWTDGTAVIKNHYS